MTDRLTKFNEETNQYEYKERAKTQEEFNAQRKAVIQRLGELEDRAEGENVGTLHPADEFICSKCGIALEGWTKVVVDEDEDDIYHYEYIFKYCPNCGAKMKGERSENGKS